MQPQLRIFGDHNNFLLVRISEKIYAPSRLLRLILPPDNQPEPDFTIVQNRADDYLSSHPMPADTLLVIEISASSLSYDQDVKLPLYAEAGISDYWIFNLRENQLEVYSEPY